MPSLGHDPTGPGPPPAYGAIFADTLDGDVDGNTYEELGAHLCQARLTAIDMPMPQEQPKNPLHGLTLKTILTELVEAYGFEDLSDKVPIRCFAHDPSIRSSLKFLRKTPWARERVEQLYLWHQRELRRRRRADTAGPA
jgi:hypothetical protein